VGKPARMMAIDPDTRDIIGHLHSQGREIDGRGEHEFAKFRTSRPDEGQEVNPRVLS